MLTVMGQTADTPRSLTVVTLTISTTATRILSTKITTTSAHHAIVLIVTMFALPATAVIAAARLATTQRDAGLRHDGYALTHAPQ